MDFMSSLVLPISCHVFFPAMFFLPLQVAANAGVKLSEADEALKALAYDSLGNLEVGDLGAYCTMWVQPAVAKGGLS